MHHHHGALSLLLLKNVNYGYTDRTTKNGGLGCSSSMSPKTYTFGVGGRLSRSPKSFAAASHSAVLRPPGASAPPPRRSPTQGEPTYRCDRLWSAEPAPQSDFRVRGARDERARSSSGATTPGQPLPLEMPADEPPPTQAKRVRLVAGELSPRSSARKSICVGRGAGGSGAYPRAMMRTGLLAGLAASAASAGGSAQTPTSTGL